MEKSSSDELLDSEEKGHLRVLAVALNERLGRNRR